MTEDLSPFEARTVEIVKAVNAGDASRYSEVEVLTTIGAVWYSRRVRASDPDADDLELAALDQSLEVLASEIEARGILAANPLRDLGER
jgi:hypothetical protein